MKIPIGSRLIIHVSRWNHARDKQTRSLDSAGIRPRCVSAAAPPPSSAFLPSIIFVIHGLGAVGRGSTGLGLVEGSSRVPPRIDPGVFGVRWTRLLCMQITAVNFDRSTWRTYRRLVKLSPRQYYFPFHFFPFLFLKKMVYSFRERDGVFLSKLINLKKSSDTL